MRRLLIPGALAVIWGAVSHRSMLITDGRTGRGRETVTVREALRLSNAQQTPV